MYQQYINSAKTSLDYLDSDELKDLLNDDDKLEQRVTDSVSDNYVIFLRIVLLSIDDLIISQNVFLDCQS